MSVIRWQSVVDFLVLAAGIYLLLRWGREARALRLALSILALRVGAFLARQLGLLITGWVLDAATVVVILALVVVFQPELRRALMRLDLSRRVSRQARMPAMSAISAAAWALARVRCGALMVIVQKDSIAELVTNGLFPPVWVVTGCPSTAVNLIRCPLASFVSAAAARSAGVNSLPSFAAGNSTMVISTSTVRGFLSSCSSNFTTSGTAVAEPLMRTAWPDPAGAAITVASPLK